MTKTAAPLLSIVTVTYRDTEGLRKTLQSLRSLRGVSWEHVVVDSSPELSHIALREFGSEWPIVHLVEKPSGIYSAMNAGIKAASGKYVWFLNGGDTLASPKGITDVLTRLTEEGQSIAIGAAEIARDGAILYSQKPRWGLAALAGINRVCHQAVIYRRTLFDQLGGYNISYRLAADYEHHLRILEAGIQVLLLDIPMARFELGGESSNIHKALGEFRLVHQNLGKSPVLHRCALEIEYFRLTFMMKVKASWIRAWAEPIWRAYKKIRR